MADRCRRAMKVEASRVLDLALRGKKEVSKQFVSVVLLGGVRRRRATRMSPDAH